MKLSAAPSRRLVLLAPGSSRIPAFFGRTESNGNLYWDQLHQMQALRGNIYLQDGAITEANLIAGRHHSDLDPSSWHLLATDSRGQVRGGARFHQHSKFVVPSDLTVSQSALACSPEWREPFRGAVESELAFSRDLDVPFVELGGWALGEEIRGTTEALRMALATYAFWEILGGAVCISSATHRNCSASILRRIGGRVLEHGNQQLPAYFEPKYNCQMEVLRFYSWAPNPRYNLWINQIREELSGISVISRDFEPNTATAELSSPDRPRSAYQTA